MLHEYIPAAIEALEGRDEPPSIVQQHHDRVDILVDLIAAESPVEPEELRITEAEYKNRIENIIEYISDSSDTVSEFHEQLEELKEEIVVEYRKFSIIFPWNFWSTSEEAFEHPVEIRDLTIQRVPNTFWDGYKERAIDESNFDKFLDEVPTRQHHNSPFSYQKYWKTEYEAAHPEFVINKLTNELAVLMGKIAFSAYFGNTPYTIRQTNWKYGITDLQHPICYLVLENEDYLHYYTSYDFTPRHKFSFKMSMDQDFNEYYPKLPDFTGDLTQVEEHLVTAFSAYHSAMSEAEPTQSFLEFWRCLEAATLTQEEDYSAREPLKRGRAAFRPEKIRISDRRIDRLVDKRNSLVHKGGQTNIAIGDRVHLKSLCEASIWFLTTDGDEFSFDDLQFLFEYGAKSEDQILQAKRNREEQISEIRDSVDSKQKDIELLDKLIDWYDIDESS